MRNRSSASQPSDPPALAGDKADRDLVPAGFRLCPDPGSRMLAGGKVLAGGYPTRVLRLTTAGARSLEGWFAGTPVP
ncbi:MAG: hypothetical protein WAK82_00015, partial [Streptosporangiaceae bacterium]